MIYREEEHVRLLKEQARTAVRLAMNGEWAEAAQLNREILEAAPDNVEAMNRLGKALTELGEPGRALDAFRRALALSPGNPIAAKNVERLLAESNTPQPRSCNGAGSTLKPRMFIAESGKSADVTLLASTGLNPSPGTPVTLEANGSTLGVMAPDNSCLGLVPSNMARRLLCLMSGGNRYEGAVSGTANGAVRVVLREVVPAPQPALEGLVPGATEARRGAAPPRARRRGRARHHAGQRAGGAPVAPRRLARARRRRRRHRHLRRRPPPRPP